MRILVGSRKFNVLEDGNWRTTTPLIYHTRKGTVVVPKGFVCDLGSIPKVIAPVLGGGDRTKNMVEAGLIHDFLYSEGKYTRKTCDLIMLDTMNYYKNPEKGWQRQAIYWAVRFFGGFFYNKD